MIVRIRYKDCTVLSQLQRKTTIIRVFNVKKRKTENSNYVAVVKGPKDIF